MPLRGRTHYRTCWNALFACLLCACDVRTDIVAKLIVRDAGAADAGCTKPGACDSGMDVRDAAPDADTEPDAEPGVDAAVDSGGPPPRGDCAAQSCNVLASRDAICAAGQAPSVTIGDSCDALNYPTFQFSVCTCSDLITNSAFEVSSADPAGASVAINGELRLGPDTSIDGSLYVSGHYGAATAPNVSGMFERGANPRCGCDSTKFLDIAGLIAARARDNENGNALLAPASLSGFNGGRSLTLDCGRYYFDRIAGNGLLQLDVRGRVALFISRDLALDDGFRLTLAPGATAEIYVGGNVLVRGKLELGAANGGGRVLLAVQGTGTIDVADTYIDGSIYAPYELLTTRGAFELHGSLFVNRANFGAATTIRYARAAAAQPRCQN